MTTVALGRFSIDLDRNVTMVDGKQLYFSRRYYKALAFLVQHRGVIIEKRDLINLLGVTKHNYPEQVVMKVIRVLRREFEKLGLPEYIEVVPKAGYRFRE